MIALLIGAALAAPCPDDGLPVGPVVAPLREGELGAPRRLCPRDEVAVGGAALLVADTANFYGHLVAGGVVRGSLAVDDRTEAWVTAEVVRYDTILGAISSDFVGTGHLSGGATRVFVDRDTLRAGAHARVVLPTASGLYRRSFPVGLDVGVGAEQPIGERLTLHEDLTLFGSGAIGPVFGPRAGVALAGGLAWRPTRGFALATDLRGGLFYQGAVDELSIAPALRFGPGRHAGIELAIVAPLVGRDRTPLAAAELRGSWRF